MACMACMKRILISVTLIHSGEYPLAYAVASTLGIVFKLQLMHTWPITFQQARDVAVAIKTHAP